MTPAFPDQHSDTRIFLLSALGSLLLHGLFVAGLSSVPQTTIVKDTSPTIQVTLLPAPAVSQPAHTPTPHLQPHTMKQATPSAPMPRSRPRLPPPAPPLQTSRQPSPPIKRSPLTPPVQAKPILKDIRASQAMKVRAMMKMRVPSHAQLTSHALPAGTTRIHAASHILPPIPARRKTHSPTRSLPAPPRWAAPHTLIATSPAPTGSTMTRPTIISSPKPIYPRVARESGWEGTVIIRTRIDTNGKPNQVNIRKSCGHPTLDQAAQDAVANWNFQPAKDGNIPITKWVDIPIKFALHR